MNYEDIQTEGRAAAAEQMEAIAAQAAREIFVREGVYTWEQMENISDYDILDEAVKSYGADFMEG